MSFRAALAVEFWAAAIVLTGAAAAQPANDECSQAAPVTEGSWIFSSVGATGTMPCPGGSNDIWCVYTPAQAGPATFDTCGSDFDTLLAVVAGACGGPVVCDDNGGCDNSSRLTLNLAAGTNYFIAVGGSSGATGSVSLLICEATTWYPDADGDEYGTDQNVLVECAQPAGYAAVGGDCNDADPEINPGATESCNGVDDNCDEQTDPAGSPGCTTYFKDADGDTYGVTHDTSCLCAPAAPYTATQGGDCDDANAAVNPGAAEACNGADDNCDNQTDPPGSQGCTTFYKDADGDTYGVTGDTSCLCAPAAPYTATQGGDCNDSDGAVNPGATETCNNVDDNCDNEVDPAGAQGCITFYRDADGDTYGVTQDTRCLCGPVAPYLAGRGGDCDDTNPLIHPGAAEPCDIVDYNCDGQLQQPQPWYRDADNDGHGNLGDVVMDCRQPPGRVSSSDDCNDGDPLTHPGAQERCNNADDDCNGQVDEEIPAWHRDADGDGFGSPDDSVQDCDQPAGYVSDDTDCNDTDSAVHPDASDDCDGVDRNCDGEVRREKAWYRDRDGDYLGDPADSVIACAGPPGYVPNRLDDDDNLKTTKVMELDPPAVDFGPIEPVSREERVIVVAISEQRRLPFSYAIRGTIPDWLDIAPAAEVSETGSVIACEFTAKLSRVPPGGQAFDLTLAIDDESLPWRTIPVSIGQQQATGPLANAGEDQVIRVPESANSVVVELDGSASTGAILSYIWYEEGEIIATGPRATVRLGPGEHEITLVVRDKDGLTASSSVQVVVEVGGESELGCGSQACGGGVVSVVPLTALGLSFLKLRVFRRRARPLKWQAQFSARRPCRVGALRE